MSENENSNKNIQKNKSNKIGSNFKEAINNNS
jgi:hypothetical protein